jgi:predicted metal-dependent phosphotriesterase family hydrolase
MIGGEAPTLLIETVLGPMHCDELGFCHSHEHVFIAPGYWETVVPSLRIDDYRLTIEELERYRSSGGLSLVDAQPVGCGRMARYLVYASRETGVNIIASTGFHKLEFYPPGHWIHTASPEQLAELFIGELTLGMYSDGDHVWPSKRLAARAGVIKIAIGAEGLLSSEYQRLLDAAVCAHRETSASLLCHTEMGKDAVELGLWLMASGVKARSIILCHLDRVSDMELSKAAASTGVYLEYDTIARSKYHSDEEEASLICSMVDAGFADQLLMGLDTTRERLSSYGGGIGLDYLKTSFIPLLLSHGLSSKDVQKMMVANPAAAFARGFSIADDVMEESK